ncbi:MAG: hypothetical protein NC184_01025 [Roseburia sp.]|nr:hypothetical protein [Roseburia sp.]
MFQLTVSVDSSKADWLYSVEDIIKNKLNNCFAVSALSMSGRRLYCGFGCEPQYRAQMLADIKECLVEMYAVVTKFDYIKKNLSLSLPHIRYEILLRTLVAFDRENEHKLLQNALHVEDGMALDGVFNFKLGELKERWLEICNLTKSNGAYLYDDQTYNELLKFLISAVNPKISKLTVCENDGKYRLTGALKNSTLDLSACDALELMYYLIDLAPLELIIDGSISNSELSQRLIGIFDAKTSATYKNKTKK